MSMSANTQLEYVSVLAQWAKTERERERERERVKSLRDFDLEFYLPRSKREVFYYWGTFNNLKRYFNSAFCAGEVPIVT